jgi:two-component system sensor histidine kinase KdpD
MLPMNTRRRLTVMRWTVAIGALAGIVLVYHEWLHVNQTTVALTLLLLILLLAAEWGLRYAVAVAVLATACYNFFFLPPIGTFTIVDPQNWLALFVFMATAMIASRLAHKAQNEARTARIRQQELSMLFRLSREFLQSESVATLVSTIPSAVASVTGATSALLYLLEGDKLFQAGTDGLPHLEVLHLQNLAHTLTGVRKEEGTIFAALRTGVRPKGLLVFRQASLSADTAEAIGGLVSIAIDRAQALESVARGEAAKESERLRGLMIDSITHELRTPLTSIKGAATTMLTTRLEEEQSYDLLTIIDEECDRLNRLVSEAVEMGQLDAQQVQMHFVAVPVAELIRNALETCAFVEEKHPVRIDVSEDLEVRADPDVLEKVICNLLENAGKYSAPGSPVRISAERKDDKVAISVADRGTGIEASELALIFERFYRAPAHVEGTSGTGMGLAISRAIAEAHQGEITVTSQPGQGSVFTLTLPASAAEAELA